MNAIRGTSQRKRLGAVLMVVAILAGMSAVGALVFATTAKAEATPRVEVDPGKALVDTQIVTVNWSGFEPGASVILRQCAGAATKTTDCSKLLQSEPTDSNGAGSATFSVVATNGNDRKLSGAPKVICDYTAACAIFVVPDESADSLGTGASAKLEFAKPGTACPTPGARAFGAEGTDAVSRAIAAWQPVLCDKPDVTAVDFVPKNDPSARQDFACGLRDLAIVQGVNGAKEACNGTGQSRADALVAPISASALGFVYNLRDQKSGKRILNLKLSASLLAQIFTGQILRWNDPRIAALNPGYNLPTKLRVVGRADASELNRQLTTYLWTKARSAYQNGGPAFADGPTDTFPSIAAVDLRTGGAAVGSAVAQPSENDPRDDPSYGYIGTLDTSAAAFWGLPSAAIQSDDGGEFVAPTPTSISKAVAALKDGSTFANEVVTSSDTDLYPLPVISSALLPTDKATGNQVDALRRFVTYAVGAGQSADVLPRGYVPLTPEFAAKAVAAAKAMPVTAAPTSNPPKGAAKLPSSPSNSTSLGGIGSVPGVSGADASSASSGSGAAPGTAAVAAGQPNIVTSVFARSGLSGAGASPLLIPALLVLAVGAGFAAQRLLRSSGTVGGSR